MDQEYPKPNFWEKRKKSPKTQKIKNVKRYAKISDTPFDQRSLIHREVWFLPCFVRQNQPKTNFFCFAILDHFQTKMFQSETTSFHYFSPRIWISKNIGHPTSGSGGKKTFKRYVKSEQTHRHTDTRTDISTYRKHRPKGPMLWTYVYAWTTTDIILTFSSVLAEPHILFEDVVVYYNKKNTTVFF